MILYRKSLKGFNKKIMIIIASYVIFAFIYYGLKYLYYGHFIPNTFYAKGVTDMSMNLWLGLKYLVKGGGMRLYLFVFIFFIPYKSMLKDYRWSFLIIFSFVYILYLWAIGGDWMIANRFFVPILPLLYILSSIGLANVILKFINRKPMRRNHVNKITNRVVMVQCVLLFGITMSFLEYNTMIIKKDYYQNEVRWSNCQYEMQWSMFGKWLKKNVSPNTIIAVGPAGKIPYYSELYTIDMWGLNDAHIAQKRSVRPAAGHKKYDFDYVLSFNPEFIIGYAGFKDEDIPSRYEKFNAPEEEYKSIDIVYRLKPEYRKNN